MCFQRLGEKMLRFSTQAMWAPSCQFHGVFADAIQNLKSAEEMEEEERAAQSAKLQELIRRGGPEDLQDSTESTLTGGAFSKVQTRRQDARWRCLRGVSICAAKCASKDPEDVRRGIR